MTAADAARRLGVKQATLYAYVSRGVLSRRRGPDGRGSLFDPDEVERLALRGRPRRPAGAADIMVESRSPRSPPTGCTTAAWTPSAWPRTHTFEDVAELLWTGQLPPSRAPQSSRASRSARTGREAQGTALPAPAGAATVAGDPGRAGGGARRPGRPARRHAAAGTVPGHRPGDGRDRSAAAAARPGGRDRGRPEHHRRPGGLPARGRRRDGRSGQPGAGGCGRGCATTGGLPPCGGPCPRRWSCWPTTS